MAVAEDGGILAVGVYVSLIDNAIVNVLVSFRKFSLWVFLECVNETNWPGLAILINISQSIDILINCSLAAADLYFASVVAGLDSDRWMATINDRYK